MADFGRYDVRYGDVYRVGRAGGGQTWPVSGGSVDHIATPRAISFDPIPNTKTFLGRGGQTSTQIVLLTKPPQSWTLLPLGESDHPDSPHYQDRDVSRRRVCAQLLKHVENKTVLWHGGN